MKSWITKLLLLVGLIYLSTRSAQGLLLYYLINPLCKGYLVMNVLRSCNFHCDPVGKKYVLNMHVYL